MVDKERHMVQPGNNYACITGNDHAHSVPILERVKNKKMEYENQLPQMWTDGVILCIPSLREF